jgi:hypothetical protein
MNESVIKKAVDAGWISFPAKVEAESNRRILSTADQFNARRAWKLWNSGYGLDYVAKAIGVKKHAIKYLIDNGKP